MKDELTNKGAAAREAARLLAKASGHAKNTALDIVADELARRRSEILAANEQDLDAGRQAGLSGALLDRLMLDQDRLEGLATDVRAVAKLPDPVGETLDMREMPNGLRVGRRTVPLGVIGAIYESRPNVTVDISALCLKSGNAVILRGGREAAHSNSALAELVRDSLEEAGLPRDAVQRVESTDRALVGRMLTMRGMIDLIIPRGGQELINRVAAEATVPAVTGGVGVCHTYVDRSADVDMAVKIVHNAKVQRPSVCNALDTVLVHSAIAPAYLPRLAEAFGEDGVEARCDRRALSILGPTEALKVSPATEEDWSTEFLSLTAARQDSGLAGRGAGPHSQLRLRPLGGDCDGRLLGGYAVPGRRGLQRRDGQRLHSLQRRRPVWARSGSRHQHQQDARARADGASGTDLVQMGRSRQRPGETVTAHAAPPRIRRVPITSPAARGPEA